MTPGKGGSEHLGLPVFNTMKDAVRETRADASVIYVPAPFVLDSVIEAVDAGVKLIVTITEGVPTLDMLKVKRYVEESGARLIGRTAPASSPRASARSASCRDTSTSRAASASCRVPVP